MNKLVKDVFLVIIGVTVAMILYLVLFGTTSLNGSKNDLVGTKTGNIEQTQAWQGVIWYMAEAIETPLSRYYYQYCYLPNLHQGGGVDKALGGTYNTAYFNGDIQKTETDLKDSALYPSGDLYNFSSSNGVYHYSTGWR